ncbi:MAG: hypothetical protein IT310_15375 [Anaerolineales bacterium]|nr:hypothetical protein [Anaerolineales bacterium]
MSRVKKCLPPKNSLLEKYSVQGNYVDCYVATIDKQVSFSEYVFAFYTTWLFKMERLILKWLANKPSTDLQARQLSNHEINHFAAWTVEARIENEFLVCDFASSTRSWLMIEKAEAGTKLYFGSAVVPKKSGAELGQIFVLLLGFHQMYSILLLYFAKQKLSRENKTSR